MRNFVMVAILAIMGLFGAASASAQGTIMPNSEVYVGYQLVNDRVSLRDGAGGFNVSGTGYLEDTYLGATAEVGANFENNESLVTVMGGLVLKARENRTFQPFVRGVLGAARTSVGNADYGFSFAAGGGLDVKVSDNVSLRAIQADYLQTHLFGVRQDNFRVGAGIVF
jgi:opacity protein-like surface antigen